MWKSVGRKEIFWPILWALACVIALWSTLHSLATDDFDGLNNMLQLPLAFPWSLIPIGGLAGGNVGDAWLLFLFGLLNAVLLSVYLRRDRATD